MESILDAKFWTTTPVVQSKMWQRLCHRIGKPSHTFNKRMGIKSGESHLSLDFFFAVQGVHQEGADLVSWVDRKCVQGKELVRVFDDVCSYCCGRDLRVQHAEGVVVCVTCGTISDECFDSPTASNERHGPSTTIGTVAQSQKPRRQNQYIYKRCNHFRFWLARVQGKEASGVKPGVIEAVRRELAKERIEYEDPRITYDKVRLMLKKMRLQRYYNNAWFITATLSGKPAPQLTALQEEKLLSLFHALQQPFAKYCPQDRVNMVSYSYLLHKMTEALGWVELSEIFPLLKSRAKIYAQDRIWKNICKEINLPFIKSIS